MIKIEAVTLEAAYQNAASQLECSVTELKIEVVQAPSKGILGLFKKPAIIVAIKEVNLNSSIESNEGKEVKKREALKQENSEPKTKKKQQRAPKVEKEATPKDELTQSESKKQNKKSRPKQKTQEKKESQNILNDTIMPTSFVSMQEEDDEEYEVSNYLADYEEDDDCEECKNIAEIAQTVEKEVNTLFDLTCFSIDSIEVSVHDENTLLVEFKGADAALLIGKEGYRYKALSYMLFNWINTKYQVQLRLEIAEFLKNQEESISKYLVGVCENIEKDGRAQTKILDGVLIQIALNELREKYPDKYIVIRSTRDGLKYIIINNYHAN